MIENLIPARTASIGAFEVRRVLPYRERRMVGPFIFVDDFGPVEIVSDRSMDVLPHPHIGLATVTYLFNGRMTHRDSIGSVQVIEPGDINWMTAGRGIAHSERPSDAGNRPGDELFGLQTWVALPEKDEECEPDFSHTGRDELPETQFEDAHIRLILGSGFGIASPVKTLGEPFYAECQLPAGGRLAIPADIEERSVYPIKGKLRIEDTELTPGTLAVFKSGSEALVTAGEETKFMIIGGTALSEKRHIWWNFVASRRELIEEAKRRWHDRQFPEIPNETGRIELPDGSFR
jgi:redox-sensitive bicupin YhaK (pirin superfamily)